MAQVTELSLMATPGRVYTFAAKSVPFVDPHITEAVGAFTPGSQAQAAFTPGPQAATAFTPGSQASGAI